MCSRAASPGDVECAQRFSDTSSTRPVRNISRDLRYGFVCAPVRKFASDASQARRKEKSLDAIHSTGERVHEMKQHSGIALHRSADVAQQDQWPAPFFSAAWGDFQELSTVADILADHP